MSKSKLPGLIQDPKSKNWKLDKVIPSFGRICRSTKTANYQAAENIALKWIAELQTQAANYQGRGLNFEQAAAHYIQTETKKSLNRDIDSLKNAVPIIGGLYINEIHAITIAPLINALQAAGQAAASINRTLWLIERILKLAASKWRDDQHRPLLTIAPPKLGRVTGAIKHTAPLEMDEEYRLLQHMAPDYRDRWQFATLTGLRDQQQCTLKWDWELDLSNLNATGFLIPKEYNKNGRDFLLLLNSKATAIVNRWRGKDADYVFCSPHGGKLNRHNNKHFKTARKAAGLKDVINWHSARATFASRLRAAGVSREDRGILMGHASTNITTQYSWADVQHLLNCLEQLCTAPENNLNAIFRPDSLRKKTKIIR